MLRDRDNCAACGRPLAPEELQFCTDMCRAGYIEVFGASSVSESFDHDDEDLSDGSNGLEVLTQNQMASEGWSQPDTAPADGKHLSAMSEHANDYMIPWEGNMTPDASGAKRPVKNGDVFRLRPPRTGVVLVRTILIDQTNPELEPIHFIGTEVCDGVENGGGWKVESLGERATGVDARTRPWALAEYFDGDELELCLDYVHDPKEIGLLVNNQERVVVSLTAESFECVQREADEESWNVAGRGDIWLLRFTLCNTTSDPIPAYVVHNQLMLRVSVESGDSYPALTGRANATVGAHLNWPRELKRFSHESPPLLPKMPTTGMLAFLVPPGGGHFTLEGAWSVTEFRNWQAIERQRQRQRP